MKSSTLGEIPQKFPIFDMHQTSKTQKKAAFRGILPQKTVILVTLSGICRFRYAEPRQSVVAIAPRANPSGSRKGQTKKDRTPFGCPIFFGDLIGTRTRVCAVRGRRPNR